MGCGNSIARPIADALSVTKEGTHPAQSFGKKPKRSTFTSIATFDSFDSADHGYFGMRVTKRYGHPSYFRLDGYDIGLRVRVKGLFSSTFVGCSRATGDKVSIKEHHLKNYPCLAKGEDSRKATGDDGESIVVRETMFLAKLNHESIPRLYEVFITDNSLFLVTNYIDPFRLTNFLDFEDSSSVVPSSSGSGNKHLHGNDIRRIAKSLCSALAHCHEHGVIIRDLTPQNIMIRKNTATKSDSSVGTTTSSVANAANGGATSIDVMIVDFSLAVADGSIQVLADHPCFDWNMVPYASPESLLGHPYSFSSDMWSLGVLMYAMYSCILPFHHDDDHVLIENIRTGAYDFEEDAFDNVDSRAKDMISSLLKPKASDRAPAKHLMKNTWLLQG